MSGGNFHPHPIECNKYFQCEHSASKVRTCIDVNVLFLYIPGLAGYKGLVNRFVLTGVDDAVVVTSGNGGEDVVVTSLVFCEGGLGGASGILLDQVYIKTIHLRQCQFKVKVKQ
jgi:hypothetical protein